MNKRLKIRDIKSEEYIELKKKLLSLSKEINDEIQNLKKVIEDKKYKIQVMINEIMAKITQEQNDLLNSELSKDFTLKNVTKMSNRVKRAAKIKIIENQEKWDLSGNPVICDECLICSRDDQPMALLMIDLSIENNKLLEENFSDFALNDEINTGTRNACAIPTGEFCVECAYTMLSLGVHPITRQRIGSVLVLGDPNIKTNNKNYLNAICCSIFGGREIEASFQILLGLFDELEKNEIINKSVSRFPSKVYKWAKQLILFNTNANLLCEDYGTNKQLLKAMFDVVSYKLSVFDIDTFFIPLRNKTLNSMSIIIRNLIENMNPNTLKDKCINIMRRLFIKTIVSKFVNICKKKVNGNKYDNITYQKLVFLTENDLFNNSITTIPLINSEKLCSFDKSKMLEILFSRTNELKEMKTTIKYFEMFINEKYKEKVQFNLISDTIMTLLELGIYILIKVDKNINDICKSDEDVLRGFIGLIKLKKHYSEEEIKILELNKDIFLYGNTKEILQNTNEQLLKLIKSISFYSRIKSTDDKHYSFICQYASHLFSPCVTKCSVCGFSFINENDILSLKSDKNFKNTCDIIKKRKYNHLSKYCYTTEYGGFNEFSNICPLHKVIRTVCSLKKYQNFQRPTRKLILDIILFLKNLNYKIRGNIYYDQLLKVVLIITWDFIQKRNKLDKDKRYLLEKEIITFKERVLIEISEPQNEYIGVEASLDGLTEEEIQNLSKDISIK